MTIGDYTLAVFKALLDVITPDVIKLSFPIKKAAVCKFIQIMPVSNRSNTFVRAIDIF